MANAAIKVNVVRIKQIK